MTRPRAAVRFEDHLYVTALRDDGDQLYRVDASGQVDGAWPTLGEPAVARDGSTIAWLERRGADRLVLHRGAERQRIDRTARIVGIAGEVVVLNASDGVWVTNLRSTPRRLTGLRVATSVADDGLVAGVSEDGVVVVDLLGRVQWSSPDWQPGSLSPDGRYVVAVGATRTRLVNAVLDARTGTLVREIDWVVACAGRARRALGGPGDRPRPGRRPGRERHPADLRDRRRGHPRDPAHVGRRDRHVPLPVRDPVMTGFAAWLDAREPALRRAVHALTGDAARTRALVRDAAVAAAASGHTDVARLEEAARATVASGLPPTPAGSDEPVIWDYLSTLEPRERVDVVLALLDEEPRLRPGGRRPGRAAPRRPGAGAGPHARRAGTTGRRQPTGPHDVRRRRRRTPPATRPHGGSARCWPPRRSPRSRSRRSRSPAAACPDPRTRPDPRRHRRSAPASDRRASRSRRRGCCRPTSGGS